MNDELSTLTLADRIASEDSKIRSYETKTEEYHLAGNFEMADWCRRRRDQIIAYRDFLSAHPERCTAGDTMITALLNARDRIDFYHETGYIRVWDRFQPHKKFALKIRRRQDGISITLYKAEAPTCFCCTSTVNTEPEAVTELVHWINHY